MYIVTAAYTEMGGRMTSVCEVEGSDNKVEVVAVPVFTGVEAANVCVYITKYNGDTSWQSSGTLTAANGSFAATLPPQLSGKHILAGIQTESPLELWDHFFGKRSAAKVGCPGKTSSGSQSVIIVDGGNTGG